MTLLTLLVAIVLGFSQSTSPPQVSTPATASASEAPARFDKVVRGDFFSGFGGDEASLRRGMEACERVLATQPNHAEALVWHGSGLMFLAGQAFMTGDLAKGGELFGRGLGEMNRAVTLQPESVGVLIPRGATLLTASANVQGDNGRTLLSQGLADYEKVLAIQAPYFDTLGDHPRGELLFGLAEGYARLGQPDKARRYFERLVQSSPSSGQAPRAKEWLASGSIPTVSGVGCVGCHK